MSDERVCMTGLDGTNPLGFLAAVGLLTILDRRADGGSRPGLAWSDEGVWCPTIYGAGTFEGIVETIMDDLKSWREEPALALAYVDDALVDPRAVPKAVRDLKPVPSVMREFLERISAAASTGGAASSGRRRSADLASAFGSELVTDNKGNTKPFAFHFTAGQQQFLKAIHEIRENLTADDFKEALLGPWTGRSRLPSMSWDSSVARIYSLRAGDPSKEKRGGVPGADWLAFVAFQIFIAVPVSGKLETTGVLGGWKTSKFTWPLWKVPATLPAVRALLSQSNLQDLSTGERKRRGIAAVLSSAITRAEQGGYGGFSPAEMM